MQSWLKIGRASCRGRGWISVGGIRDLTVTEFRRVLFRSMLAASDCLVASLRCAVALVVGAGWRRLVSPVALSRCGAVLIGVGLTWLAMQGPASAADLGDAVMIEGAGGLTTCRSWIFFTSCATHKVRLPERVSAGD